VTRRGQHGGRPHRCPDRPELGHPEEQAVGDGTPVAIPVAERPKITLAARTRRAPRPDGQRGAAQGRRSKDRTCSHGEDDARIRHRRHGGWRCDETTTTPVLAEIRAKIKAGIRVAAAASPPRRRGRVSFRQVLIAIVAVILVAFGIANFDTVQVNFLLFDSEARLVTVIVVAAGLGFVIGYFVGRPGRLQRKYLKQREEDRD